MQESMMSLKPLPEIRADFRMGAARFDVRPEALEKWTPEIRAAADTDATISVYDVIGTDPFTGEGVTAKRIGAALRSIGPRDVVVNVNSPGGDFFEGVAIYNLLREHRGKVTVRVMGLAASAASIIAMAGDELLMGDGAFLMIHNAWTIAIGNRHDLADAAERLAPFDSAMADVYANRSGISRVEVQAMMDREVWLGAADAIDMGFADGLMDGSDVTKDEGARTAERRALAMVEAAMAKAGYSRSQRRETLKSLFDGKPRAADEDAKPRAGETDAADSLRSLLSIFKE
jgi:ATP-dependent Clp protease, protease subunit